MAWICHEYKMTPAEYKKLTRREARALAEYLTKHYSPKEGDTDE